MNKDQTKEAIMRLAANQPYASSLKTWLDEQPTQPTQPNDVSSAITLVLDLCRLRQETRADLETALSYWRKRG